MQAIRRTVRFLFNHPLTRNNKISALWRFFKWQLVTRMFPFPFVHPFVENSKLLVSRSMTGATGNVYAGMHEFEDMAFVLHMLRPGDVFGDIGANIGSYTILASGVARAQSITIEPIPSTFSNLKNNVSINNIESLVTLHNCGLGKEHGQLLFTESYDTINHVISKEEAKDIKTIEVPIRTMEELFTAKRPVLVKMDVEGFEMSVLQGGHAILKDPQLKAMIVELNGSCHRYGIKEEDIHQLLLSYGLSPYSYLPFERKLKKLDTFDAGGNTIYVREEKWIQDRLSSARQFSVLNKTF
jgi:FkbM family methyltransferase